MRRKTFIISIPMLPAEDLRMLDYRRTDGSVCRTRFPGIAMLKGNIFGEVEIKIITVRTDDDAGRTKYCYELFKQELLELSEEAGVDLQVNHAIIVPHNENEAKEKQLLRDLFQSFPHRSDIYMDVTNGSKLTAIELFSSLCYAETAEECSIKSIVYGKYSHDGSMDGELFDVTELYHTMRLLETATHMEKSVFKDMVRGMFA